MMNCLHSVLQHKTFLEKFWSEWFTYPLCGRETFKVYRYDKNGRPEGTRIFLRTPEEFLRHIQYCWKKRFPCWLSVQPFNERDHVTIIERVFFEFDSLGNLSRAWNEARIFAQALKRHYNVEPFLAFSGRKGYHIYVWLQKPEKFETTQQAKQFYETVENMILKGLNLESLDVQVIGDVKRVARVPYTLHEKTLDPCVPITLDHTPCLIVSLEGFRQHGLPETFNETAKHAMQKQQQQRRILRQRIKMPYKKVRPCIQAALGKKLEGESGHLMRLAIAVEYLHTSMSTEDVARLFAAQPDYDFEKSMYFVKHAQKNRYKPFKCKTIRKLGFCLNCKGVDKP